MDMVTAEANRDELIYGGIPPEEAPRMILGMRASALLELLLFLLGALVVDALWGAGERFLHAEPHPFWIIVLLLSVQYGALPGLVAALASTLVLIVANPAVSFDGLMTPESLNNPAVLNPVLWIIASIAFGEIRQRHIREKKRVDSKWSEATARESLTAEAYSEVRERKQRLEERVSGEMRSALTVYRSAKALETMSPAHLMRAVEQVVSDLLGAQVFSLFLHENNTLNTVVTLGWTDAYARLPRRYASSSTLYQWIVGRREILTVANAEHERVLGTEGVLAAPIVTPTGEVLGMLKIESLPFARFGINTIETLRAIADWTAAALANARHYQQALESAVQDPRHQLMTSSYFERYTAFVTALGKRAKFPVSMIGVGLNLPEGMAEEEQINIARALADAVRESLRAVDMAFDYQEGTSQYNIVLPTTSREGAEIVRDKITASLEQKLKAQNLRYPFSTSVQELTA